MTEKITGSEEKRKEIDHLRKTVATALKETFKTHCQLGESGLDLQKKNQFGETALRADWEAEEAVISILTRANIPIKIVSEEHGVVVLGENPRYLGVLDGLDGTGRYRAFMEGEKEARYGTMFSIFKGLYPKYDDYLVSGIMEHPTKRLFIASRGQGASVSNLEKNVSEAIKVSQCKTFDQTTKIFIDANEVTPWFDFILETFVRRLPKGFDYKCLYSSTANYVDLASGEIDLVLECTRKGSLEVAVAYGLVKEAGGVMAALDGRDLGPQKYWEFGQDKYTPVVTAASWQLAQAAVAHFRKD